MPVLSWSLGCQPEYGEPEPSTANAAATTPRADLAPKNTPSHGRTEAGGNPGVFADPGGTSGADRRFRHTWATLPVPRKGPQAGEVRTRYTRRNECTSPSPARLGTQDPLPGKARLARPSEPILVPKLRIKIADFPYLH